MNETVRRFLSVPAVCFCYHCGCGCGAVPDNLYFHGTLVDEPCTIHPGDETVELPFGNIPDKNLYAYQRTPSKDFRIRLSECDTSIGKRVTVMFAGMRIRLSAARWR